ncbi:MAG TPA: divalent-cation tolerance protein CutA [Candidatus Acidoferrales bacterium]|nr:divalent-cation tolerance protein CutA [Candidatus Acidoferrales bacterium]
MNGVRMAAEEIVVLVTCGSAKEARHLSEVLVRKKLAACVNMTVSPIRSVYRWKGKVEAATEVLMLIKTTQKRFGALEKAIQRLHSYETPEIIALPIVAGSTRYLKWLRESLKA